MKSRKRKLQILFGIIITLVVIIAGFKIKYRYDNKIWYGFKDEILEEYPLIKSVKKSDYGPYCSIWIYLKEDNVEIGKVEKILGVVLKNINNQEFCEYIRTTHDSKASGEFSFINIRFKYKNDKSHMMYDFESMGKERPYYSRFYLWRGIDESAIGREYELSDYK